MKETFPCSKCGSKRAKRETDPIGHTMTCLTCGDVRYFDSEGEENAPAALEQETATVDGFHCGNCGGRRANLLEESGERTILCLRCGQETHPEGSEQEQAHAGQPEAEAGEAGAVQPEAADREAGVTEAGSESEPGVESEVEVESGAETAPGEAGATAPAADRPETARVRVPRRDRERLNICMKCGLEPARNGRRTGETCAEENRQYQKRHYREMMEARKPNQQQPAERDAEPGADVRASQDETGAGAGEFIVGNTYSSEQITLKYLEALLDIMETALTIAPEDRKTMLRLQAEAIRVVILIMPKDEDENLAKLIRESGKLG